MQNNAQLVPEQKKGRRYWRMRGGGGGATLWQSRKKLTFALIIKLTKRSGAASTLKGGKWRRGAAQKWTEHLSGHTLNPLPPLPPHTHNTRHPLSGKQKHVRRHRERGRERGTADWQRTWLADWLSALKIRGILYAVAQKMWKFIVRKSFSW